MEEKKKKKMFWSQKFSKDEKIFLAQLWLSWGYGWLPLATVHGFFFLIYLTSIYCYGQHSKLLKVQLALVLHIVLMHAVSKKGKLLQIKILYWHRSVRNKLLLFYITLTSFDLSFSGWSKLDVNPPLVPSPNQWNRSMAIEHGKYPPKSSGTKTEPDALSQGGYTVGTRWLLLSFSASPSPARSNKLKVPHPKAWKL